MQTKRPRSVALQLVLDVFAVGALLLVFALFHHVLPRRGGGLNQSIVSFASPTAQVVTPTPEPTPEPVVAGTPAPTPTPSPSPSPSPTPAPGDFSATFPDYDTSLGVDALHSYQSDDLRVVITQGYVNEATYYVADVWVRHISSFKTGFAGGEYARGVYDTTQQIASDCGAVVAVNGDYCGAHSGGVVIRNGVLYREGATTDVCVLYADGVMETYTRKAFSTEAAVARGAYQAWNFGPLLLENGQIPASYSTSLDGGRDPRTAIGYYAPGHYCLVLVDGRRAGYSRGLTLTQLSELFLSLGCTVAYNLDGGQTSVMTFQGEIVGQPYKGGRVVSDIVYF